MLTIFFNALPSVNFFPLHSAGSESLLPVSDNYYLLDKCKILHLASIIDLKI